MSSKLIKTPKRQNKRLAYDAGSALSEKQLTELERKIGKTYAKAAKDLSRTIDKYWRDLKRRDAEMRARLKIGDIDKDYYKKWLKNQIGRGERYEALREELVNTITNVNITANEFINRDIPGIYALNRNYTSYIIHKVHPQVNFILYNKHSIRRLLLAEPKVMPHYPKARAIKRGIDLEYGNKIIRNTITQGILKGEGIPKIEKRLRDNLINMNRASSVRAARTAYTNAQNAGQLDQMLEAEKQGIKMKKQWLSTSDGRTRDSHIGMNGEIKPLREPFSNGLLYPADSKGKPAEVYNCRCTMIAVIDGVNALDAQPMQIEQETREFKKYLRRSA